MTTTLRNDVNYPGTDLDPWPAAFTAMHSATGGTTDIIANGLRAATASTGGFADYVGGMLNDSAVNGAADLGCVIHWDFANQTPLRDAGLGIFLRASNDWSWGDNPNNWVGTFIDAGGGPDIEYRNNGGTRTTVVGMPGGSIPLTSGVSNYCRFEAQGTTLRARYWIGTATEPTAWSMQVTNASVPTGAGRFAFRVIGAGAAGVVGYARIRDALFYDFTNPPPPPPPPPPPAGAGHPYPRHVYLRRR
jgi:hypothetical protein